jgi:hypothetical protein
LSNAASLFSLRNVDVEGIERQSAHEQIEGMRASRRAGQSVEKGKGQLPVEEFLKPVIDGVRDAERVRRNIPTQRLLGREGRVPGTPYCGVPGRVAPGD